MYLTENSEIKDVFQESSYPEIQKTYFLAPKCGAQPIHGINLCTGKYDNKYNSIQVSGYLATCKCFAEKNSNQPS